MLDLVEDPLGDLALADLAPFPVPLADDLVEMFLGHADAAEPDLVLAIPYFLQFDAPRKVEEV